MRRAPAERPPSAAQPAAQPDEPLRQLREHLHLHPEAKQLQRRARVKVGRQLAQHRDQRPEGGLLVAVDDARTRELRASDDIKAPLLDHALRF